MKRRQRTISIFSMSALDVLALATGVFVLLLVMLMPYYRKTLDANAEIQGARMAAAETLAEVQALETTAARYRAEAGAATNEAAELDARAAAPKRGRPRRRQPNSTPGRPLWSRRPGRRSRRGRRCRKGLIPSSR